MKLIIAGASGMVGSLVLEKALNDPEITSIVSLVRKESTLKSEKLKEVVVSDFGDLDEVSHHFSSVAAAFFCIGVYTGQVSDDLFKVITYDYAVEFGRVMHEKSPLANLCLLSGQGADRSEKSRVSFAKYKGMAENKCSALYQHFYAFRPGYIYPVTPRNEPNFMYKVSRFLYPVFRMMGKGASIKSTELAEVMFYIGKEGSDQEIWENKHMRELVII